MVRDYSRRQFIAGCGCAGAGALAAVADDDDCHGLSVNERRNERGPYPVAVRVVRGGRSHRVVPRFGGGRQCLGC